MSVRPGKPHLLRQPGLIATVMLVLMTVNESVKQLLLPDISIWRSHAITIVLATILATMVSHSVLKRFHDIYHKRLDETARRQTTEEALKESESEYRLLFEQSRDAINIVTREGGRYRRQSGLGAPVWIQAG